MDNSLHDFITHSKSSGKSDAEIKASLSAAGWPDSDISHALQGPSSSTPAPLVTGSSSAPGYHPNLGMWTVFEYVLMFITLSSSATGLAGLLHHLVNNKLAPVKAAGYSFYGFNYYDYLVTFYLASLIIGFPIFAFLALKLRAQLMKYPEIRKIK